MEAEGWKIVIEAERFEGVRMVRLELHWRVKVVVAVLDHEMTLYGLILYCGSEEVEEQDHVRVVEVVLMTDGCL